MDIDNNKTILDIMEVSRCIGLSSLISYDRKDFKIPESLVDTPDQPDFSMGVITFKNAFEMFTKLEMFNPDDEFSLFVCEDESSDDRKVIKSKKFDIVYVYNLFDVPSVDLRRTNFLEEAYEEGIDNLDEWKTNFEYSVAYELLIEKHLLQLRDIYRKNKKYFERPKLLDLVDRYNLHEAFEKIKD